MRIRYERTMDDILALNEFSFHHSPTTKRIVSRYRWTGALAIWLLAALLVYVLVPAMPIYLTLLLAFIDAAYFAVVAPRIVLKKTKHNIRKQYAEGQNATLLGEQELELTDTGLIARSKYAETKLAWGAIEKIETTPEHTFLFVSSVNAYIIPHTRILEGDYRALMAEIGRRFQPGQPLQTITS